MSFFTGTSKQIEAYKKGRSEGWDEAKEYFKYKCRSVAEWSDLVTKLPDSHLGALSDILTFTQEHDDCYPLISDQTERYNLFRALYTEKARRKEIDDRAIAAVERSKAKK